MNKGPQETAAFCDELLATVETVAQQNFVIFPPAVNLPVLQQKLQGTQFQWGGQNCYFEDSGAFTGENSPAVLAELGASHCLVAHSERRQLFHETDEEAAKKVRALQNNKICPILCVGETLEQRNAQTTKEVISRQVQAGLDLVNWDKPFWLAYEPVWAIGTGEVATPEQAEQVHAELRAWLADKMDRDRAANTPLLYGGSVKPTNAASLGEQPNIDGFLVGGSSLKPDSFVDIWRQSS